MQHLAGAYFHQDYDLDAGSPAQVIEVFIAGEDHSAVIELVAEIDTLLGSDMTDDELADLWVKEWRASYDPRDEQQSIRTWLTSVRSRLADGRT